MPSPFPGMNPYLEQDYVWHDFHESFMPAARDQLSPQILPRYFVKIDEHVYVHELPAGERQFVGRADVGIVPASVGSAGPQGVALVEAPAQVQLPVPVDFEQHSYLEIRDRQNRELITVIELLSPTNKRPGPDREQFLAKRTQFLRSSANFVEIDLLRGGPRLPMKHLPPCDYYALVSRPAHRPAAGVWPLHLSDPLPSIPVPLRAGEPDAKLDLQNILHRIYDSAGYEVYIYDGSPDPPVTPDQAAWVQQFVPGKSSER